MTSRRGVRNHDLQVVMSLSYERCQLKKATPPTPAYNMRDNARSFGPRRAQGRPGFICVERYAPAILLPLFASPAHYWAADELEDILLLLAGAGPIDQLLSF